MRSEVLSVSYTATCICHRWLRGMLRCGVTYKTKSPLYISIRTASPLTARLD
jgi:hypothetical protein